MYFSKLLLADIIAFAVAKGASEVALCDELGIERLKKIDPREQISYQEMIYALNLVGERIKDENLGLHLGAQFSLQGTMQVDVIMKNSKTIEEAFANAIEFSKLISDALKSSMQRSAQSTTIAFEVNPNWAILENHAVQQIIDMTLVSAQKSIFWLTNRKEAPIEVHLPVSSLKNRREYYRIFDCPIKLNENVPKIIFRNQLLEQTIANPDVGLLTRLKKRARIEIEQLESESNLIIAVKKKIYENLPERLTVENIALVLHFSPRTFQRKLQKEKTTFKQIEKELIVQLAQKFIRYEDLGLNEIAYLLGFSEASALIRFFKQETKLTPRQYRKKILSA